MNTTVPVTTDRISLIGLPARGHCGVLSFEREEDRPFTVGVILDLEQCGTAVAAVTDSVTDAVDYSRVASGTVSIIEGEPVSLIESLVDRIAGWVLSFPRVVTAEVIVYKPGAPLDAAFEDVSVTIHRVADATAGHGGAPVTNQAVWAVQAEVPVTVSVRPYASPFSSASSVAAVSPAAPAYEPPVALAAPAVSTISEVPDFSGASFTDGDAAPAALASEAPIIPTPSSASLMEAPARSPFATAAPSVPTPMPTEPGILGGSAESTQPWVPDWATKSVDSSASSAPVWTLEVPEAPEATGLPSGESAVSYSVSSALDVPSTSAPTAASAGRTADVDGPVSLVAEVLGAAPISSEPEPSALSYAEEMAADAAAAALSEPVPATDGLAVQLPHKGHHVASSEEDEDQFVPVVEGFADPLGGPVVFDELGFYSGAASSQVGEGGDITSEAVGIGTSGFAFPTPGRDAITSGIAGADGLMGVSSVPASQPLGEPGPSPFAVSGEPPEVAGQEGVAPASSEPSYSQPSVSGDFSQPVEGSHAAPSAQPDFLGIPGAASVPAASETPAAPAAPVNLLSERPTRSAGAIFDLGANVSGVVDSLRTAIQSLKVTKGIEVTQVASLVRMTAIVAKGAESQPDYLNTVVTAMTILAPRELLEVCQTLEIAAGRARTEPWGVRALDVDLIEVEGVTSSDPALSLLHPRVAERVFVLVPWSQADPFTELAGHSVSELAESAPDRGGLHWLAFGWLGFESLPDKPTGPYMEPSAEQDVAGSRPGLVYDTTRDESSVADTSLAADYTGSIVEALPAAPESAPAQPLGDQGQTESSPFGQLPSDTSNGAGSWAEQTPQVDPPCQAASAPEAAGPQGSYALGLSAGPDGVSRGQQDETAGDAWKSPLQWNGVIGGGTQGTSPRQDV